MELRLANKYPGREVHERSREENPRLGCRNRQYWNSCQDIQLPRFAHVVEHVDCHHALLTLVESRHRDAALAIEQERRRGRFPWLLAAEQPQDLGRLEPRIGKDGEGQLELGP